MDAALPIVLDGGLHIYAGDDSSFPVEFFDDTEAATPTDLRGFTLTAQWRPTRSATRYVDLVVEVTDAQNGKITLKILSAASTAIVADSYNDVVSGVWDIQGDDGTSTVTYITGDLFVTRDVTHG